MVAQYSKAVGKVIALEEQLEALEAEHAQATVRLVDSSVVHTARF